MNLKNHILLRGGGVVVRDLYEMNFDPVLSSRELKDISSGLISKDVAVEQDHIRRTDVLHFIYPVWWTGMPAILKGYIDRVFSYGFAYLSGEDGIIGLMKGKKVFIYNSLGQSREEYEKEMFRALDLTSDKGIFNFCGMEVVDHLYFPSIKRVSAEVRKEYLQEVWKANEKLYHIKYLTI